MKQIKRSAANWEAPLGRLLRRREAQVPRLLLGPPKHLLSPWRWGWGCLSRARSISATLPDDPPGVAPRKSPLLGAWRKWRRKPGVS